MSDFLAAEDRALLERHGLATFDALWARQLDAVDEPNTSRGGWSSVFRLELDGHGYYLKRQSNYLTRSLHRPLGEPSFFKYKPLHKPQDGCATRIYKCFSADSNLLPITCTPDALFALKKCHRKTALSPQIVCGNKAADTSADDDDVVALLHDVSPVIKNQTCLSVGNG